MFLLVIFLTIYKKFEFVIFEKTDDLIQYNYCDMQTYFHTDVASAIILSVVCSVKAFRARKLPANYNETYYIFLGIFATTNLLMLSIPLDASFNTDGGKVFVNSFAMYSANMAFISIACGYKIQVCYFRNTKTQKKLSKKVCKKLCKTISKE